MLDDVCLLLFAFLCLLNLMLVMMHESEKYGLSCLCEEESYVWFLAVPTDFVCCAELCLSLKRCEYMFVQF